MIGDFNERMWYPYQCIPMDNLRIHPVEILHFDMFSKRLGSSNYELFYLEVGGVWGFGQSEQSWWKSIATARTSICHRWITYIPTAGDVELWDRKRRWNHFCISSSSKWDRVVPTVLGCCSVYRSSKFTSTRQLWTTFLDHVTFVDIQMQ